MALPKVKQNLRAVRETECCDKESLSHIPLKYIVLEKRIVSPLLGEYISFGIAATDESERCLCSIHDITCQKEQLEGLVNLCNRLNLSFCHLYDVIEDFLS